MTMTLERQFGNSEMGVKRQALTLVKFVNIFCVVGNWCMKKCQRINVGNSVER